MNLWIGINRFVNLCGIAAALALISSGLVLTIRPRDAFAMKPHGHLGLNGESWLEVFESAVVGFIAIVIIHLIFHARQLVGMCRQFLCRSKRLLREPAVILIILFSMLLTANALPDEATEEWGDDCAARSAALESIATYSHIGAGVLLTIFMSLHVLRRWRRIMRSS